MTAVVHDVSLKLFLCEFLFSIIVFSGKVSGIHSNAKKNAIIRQPRQMRDAVKWSVITATVGTMDVAEKVPNVINAKDGARSVGGTKSDIVARDIE